MNRENDEGCRDESGESDAPTTVNHQSFVLHIPRGVQEGSFRKTGFVLCDE